MAIAKRMKAAVWAREGDYSTTLIDKPIPKPAPHQVLVRIKAASLCHTDNLATTGIFGPSKEVGFPIVAGHEGVGVVIGLGQQAREEGKWAVGDRVGGLLNTGGCRHCGECKNIITRYCSKAKMMGLKGADGFFAEYALMDKDWIIHLPEDVSDEQAAPLTCAGVTIYAAIQKAQLKKGQILLISGLGGLGYLGAQIAQAKGYKVVGIDINPARLEALSDLPSRLRPDLLINAVTSTPEAVLPLINDLRDEGYDGCSGVDAAIIATDSPLALDYVFPLLATRSKLIITAGPPTFSIPLIPLIFRDLTIISSLNGSVQDLEETVRFCSAQGIESLVRVEGWDGGRGVERLMDNKGGNWQGKKGVVVF